MLPLSLPVLATAAIIALMYNWNSFIFPLIILNDTDKFTLSIGLRYFAISLLGAGATSDAKPLTTCLAGSIMMTIPIIVIFFFGQRYFVTGSSYDRHQRVGCRRQRHRAEQTTCAGRVARRARKVGQWT